MRTPGITSYPDTTSGGSVGGLPIQESDVVGLVADLAARFTTAGAGLNKSGQTVAMNTQSVTPATYGDASHVPVLTLDARGVVTGVTLASLSAGTVPYITNGSSGITTVRLQVGTATFDMTIDGTGALVTTAVSTGGTTMEWIDGSSGTWIDTSSVDWMT